MASVRGVVLIFDGEGYQIAGEFSGPAVGALDQARFGSVACLAWETADA